MVSIKRPKLLRRKAHVVETATVTVRSKKVLALIVGVCMDVYELEVPDILETPPNCLPECKCRLYYEIERQEWLERNG